jgi:hypothetical protein
VWKREASEMATMLSWEGWVPWQGKEHQLGLGRPSVECSLAS